MDIFQSVAKVIADYVGKDVSEIKEETSLADDLGMDSLDSVEVIMSLEDEFGISISGDSAKALSTVGEVCKLVEELKGE
ncbi:MAG: acyl carrier protein [Ruminococcus sp.]|jgi:acyl carrier protein|nr:acyl carrier protein [Ruminococcus sp.]